ncbi:MAG: hypothetical protein AAF602_16215 [Myxococcota bacterium]
MTIATTVLFVFLFLLVGCKTPEGAVNVESPGPVTEVGLILLGLDEAMISNSTRTEYRGKSWDAGGTGTTANVLAASEETQAAFTETARGEGVFEGVTAFTSLQGPDIITLSSSMQSATARFDSGRYVIEGLQAAAAFAAEDTLTVEADGETVEVDAPMPLPADPDTWLSAPDGLQTEVSLADGSFDGLFVYLLATGSSQPGQAGALGFVRSEELALEDGLRTGPLLSPTTIAELDARGLTPTDLWFGPMNVARQEGWFERELSVRAGRLFQTTGADLGLVTVSPDDEPCDYLQPREVQVGKTISSDADSCPDNVHYYRFVPPTEGVYTIEKTGARTLGYCEEEFEGGCICAFDINCCVDCTLDFSLPGGAPLPAGEPKQIYLDSSFGEGAYSFTITGPNP